MESRIATWLSAWLRLMLRALRVAEQFVLCVAMEENHRPEACDLADPPTTTSYKIRITLEAFEIYTLYPMVDKASVQTKSST